MKATQPIGRANSRSHPGVAATVTFPRTRHIRKLGLVGQGQVVQERIWPALQAINYPLDGLVVCSLEEDSHLPGLPHQYYPVSPESMLPLDILHQAGFLNPHTLWIVAAPSDVHPLYALQLAGLARVAIEKPVAATADQARLLLPFADHWQLYSMNHKVFNAPVLAFLDSLRQDPALLRRVRHIEGVFYERAGLKHGRQQEDCLADVQWHLLISALIAPFKTAGLPFEVTVERAWAATHTPDPEGQYALPKVWTASRVRGQVLGEGQEVTYDHRQAKGAPTNAKAIRLYDGEGVLLKEIDLNETGSQAHARMLLVLMQPLVDMRVSLVDAINAVTLIDISRKIAREEPPYPFGTLPPFLS